MKINIYEIEKVIEKTSIACKYYEICENNNKTIKSCSHCKSFKSNYQGDKNV